MQSITFANDLLQILLDNEKDCLCLENHGTQIACFALEELNSCANNNYFLVGNAVLEEGNFNYQPLIQHYNLLLNLDLEDCACLFLQKLFSIWKKKN